MSIRGLGRVACLLRASACLRDGLERLALVRGVALDRLDQVRDQVPAPLQLHLDLRPRVVDAVPQPDEAVVEDADRDREEREYGEDHDRPDHSPTLTRLCSGIAGYAAPVAVEIYYCPT